MSEFTETAKERVEQLIAYALDLHLGKNGAELIKKYQITIDNLIPSDLISVFDRLIQESIAMADLKTLANKTLNVFYKSINEFNTPEPKENSFIDLLIKDNAILTKKLTGLKTDIKRFNKQPELLNSNPYLKKLIVVFEDIQVFTVHYTLKENTIFPILEEKWAAYRCVQLMWSYHDDIRKNLKLIIEQLNSGNIDLKRFNRLIGDLFFAMYAIIFRENKILFPTILETIPEDVLTNLLSSFEDINLAYADTSNITFVKKEVETKGEINLGTGSVSVEQIKMMFNYLPVDITYVDENDEVKYFSTPKHRIFPRTTAVIGRKVHHCHPPESVHIVEKIVESFKNGKKDEAAFWIKMGPNFVLIKYFAVRDKNKQYRGVLEVSQEVSEIRALKGERRLLDW